MSEFTKEEPAPRPRKFRVIVPLVAVAALGAAGTVIWVSIKDDVSQTLATVLAAKAATPPAPAQQPAAPPAASNRPIEDDEPAFWSTVAIYKAGPDRPRPIVVVTRGKQPDSMGPQSFSQGLLAREIVRQGLLLAAREEFAAITRDVPIGEPAPAGKPDATCRIGSRFRTLIEPAPNDPPVGRVTIVQGEGPQRQVVWSSEFDCGMNVAPTYPRLVMFVERFTREDFAKALEKLGLARRPNPPPQNNQEGKLPPGIEERLGRLTETEAFAAIRALHEEIRTRGETSTLLIALARAYANLGSLAESQWTADYLAFQARGLLYAQRAVVRDHDAPPSLRGQAYVEAFAGLSTQAVVDLDAADKVDGGKESPPWAAAIRAFSHSDADALGKLINSRPDALLPRYLRFLSLLSSSGFFFGEDLVCRHEILAAGRAVLDKAPDCFRVYDGMTSTQGVANLHASTSIPLELYPQVVPHLVKAVPDLPQAAARRIDAGKVDEVALRNDLVAASADDNAELSWGVLARQLREIRYLLVCRRLHFLAYSLATDYTGFAAESLPLVADHPNKGYMECATEGYSSPDAPRTLESLDLADFESKAHDIFIPFRRLVPDFAIRIEFLGFAHTNLGTLPGHIDATKRAEQANRWMVAYNLLRFDPESPLGRAAMIQSRWDEAAPKAAAWEKDHGGADTPVLGQLGLHALKEGKLDDAQRRLEQALARSPELWIFNGLVQVYQKKDQVDRWKKAVEGFLKGEDENLDHAHVTLDLARYLMNKGKYADAWPYAERAASSWAGWAMPWASHCAEKLNDWENAELWIARTSQRYSNQWLEWFAWCQRTGHGDAHSAAQLVESQVEAGRHFASVNEATQVALLYLLDGHPVETRGILEQLFKSKSDTTTGVMLAWACDLAGDAKARDATLKAVATDPKPSGPKTARVIDLLAKWLAKGEKSALDLKPIDGILEEIKPESRPTTAAIIGLFLDRHGKQDDAAKYLKQADTDRCYLWFRFLARSVRGDRGVKLDPISS